MKSFLPLLAVLILACGAARAGTPQSYTTASQVNDTDVWYAVQSPSSTPLDRKYTALMFKQYVLQGQAGTVVGFNPVTGKTLVLDNSITLAGTDGATLNVGAGGTLGALAYLTPGTGVTTAAALPVNGAGGFPTLDSNGYLAGSVPLVIMSSPTTPVLGSSIGGTHISLGICPSSGNGVYSGDGSGTNTLVNGGLFVPKTLTVNGHALSGNVTVSASDVSAIPTSAIDTDATLSSNDNAHVPSTASMQGYVAAHAGGGSGSGFTGNFTQVSEGVTYYANAGDRIFNNMQGGLAYVYLPPSPNDGDTVVIYDLGGSDGSNGFNVFPCTVDGGSNSIVNSGTLLDLTVNLDQTAAIYTFTYDAFGTTYDGPGWALGVQINVFNQAP